MQRPTQPPNVVPAPPAEPAGRDVLPYRRPEGEPRSQWITDDDPRPWVGPALVVGLSVGAAIVALVGTALWLAGWYFGS